jgi:hypothetical protein
LCGLLPFASAGSPGGVGCASAIPADPMIIVVAIRAYFRLEESLSIVGHSFAVMLVCNANPGRANVPRPHDPIGGTARMG